MSDVFISYKSEQRPLAAAIADLLEIHRIQVWWDHSLLAGHRFDAQLLIKLVEAKVTLAIWSAASVSSVWCDLEWRMSAHKGRLIILRIDDVPIPESYSKHQYIDLRSWDGNIFSPQGEKIATSVLSFMELPALERVDYSAFFLPNTDEPLQNILKPIPNVALQSPKKRESWKGKTRVGFSFKVQHAAEKFIITLLALVFGVAIGLLTGVIPEVEHPNSAEQNTTIVLFFFIILFPISMLIYSVARSYCLSVQFGKSLATGLMNCVIGLTVFLGAWILTGAIVLTINFSFGDFVSSLSLSEEGIFLVLLSMIGSLALITVKSFGHQRFSSVYRTRRWRREASRFVTRT